MGQKAITIYTPEGTAAHISAEDDAFIHRCMLGGESGILGALKCEKVDDNTLRLSDGGVSNKGFILWIPDGEDFELAVDNGEPGKRRVDIVAAAFTMGGGATPDAHSFVLVKGTPASGEPSPPTDRAAALTHLTPGGTTYVRLFYVDLNGTQITGIRRVASMLPASASGAALYVQQAQPSSPAVGDLWLW